MKKMFVTLENSMRALYLLTSFESKLEI